MTPPNETLRAAQRFLIRVWRRGLGLDETRTGPGRDADGAWTIGPGMVMFEAAVDEAAGGFACPAAVSSPALPMWPARAASGFLCLAGNSSPPSDAPRQRRPALRCPGAARAAQPSLS